MIIAPLNASNLQHSHPLWGLILQICRIFTRIYYISAGILAKICLKTNHIIIITAKKQVYSIRIFFHILNHYLRNYAVSYSSRIYKNRDCSIGYVVNAGELLLSSHRKKLRELYTVLYLISQGYEGCKYLYYN